jgi:hypothetical protein
VVLEAQGDKADLAAITPEDFYVLQMIAGAYDDQLRTKFLREGNQTKVVLLRIAKEPKRPSSPTVHWVKRWPAPTPFKKRPRSRPEKTSKRASAIRDFVAKIKKERKCAFCGRSCDRCVKRNKLRCSHCDKKGHLAIVCTPKVLNLPLSLPRQGQKTYTKAVTGEDESEESASTITIAAMTSYAPTPRIWLKLQHGKSSFDFHCMPDFSALRTIIAHNVAMKHSLCLDHGDRVNIWVANGEKMPCEGAVTVNARLGESEISLRALASSALKD